MFDDVGADNERVLWHDHGVGPSRLGEVGFVNRGKAALASVRDLSARFDQADQTQSRLAEQERLVPVAAADVEDRVQVVRCA